MTTPSNTPARPLASARSRLSALTDQHGFTLIELLVVILVLGILASIAIASYLSQANKGQDVAAKSQVRDLQGKVEACALENGKYTDCDTAAELGNDALNGIEFVDPTVTPPAGKITVAAAGSKTYTVKATSKSGHEFSAERKSDGSVDRTCTVKGKGGCRDEGAALGVW
jgi:prepilin-type N-terminal cleavage/methylation domain-containing protein